MRKPFTPQEKQRIRKRYRGYAYLLVVVSLAVLMQPLALGSRSSEVVPPPPWCTPLCSCP